MSKLHSQLVTPQSLLIEKTALEFAAVYYEAGRSTGLTSVHKDARSYAKANVKQFIPLAVNHLMSMLGMPHIPQNEKDMIYDAFMERSNDKELSNIGIKAFENNTPFIPDYVAPSSLDMALSKAMKEMDYGQKDKLKS